MSADVFAGAIKGSINDLQGTTINQNIVIFGLVSITFINDFKTSEFLGATIGFGPFVPIPIQPSVTVSETVISVGKLR